MISTYSIQSSQGYWQCGTWVQTLFAATKYPSESEAYAVAAMRNLPNSIVVLNNEAWRDLRPREPMKNQMPNKESAIV